MSVALEVLKPDKLIEVIEVHPLNILWIHRNEEVSKCERSIYFKDLHPKNKWWKCVTKEVLNLDKSKYCNDLQFWKTKFILVNLEVWKFTNLIFQGFTSIKHKINIINIWTFKIW